MLWLIRQLIGFGLPSGIARALAFAVPLLLIGGAVLLGVRSCDRKDDKLVETATQAGKAEERAAVNQGVIEHAEKVAKADAAIRGSTVTERMREDRHCRDCADGE